MKPFRFESYWYSYPDFESIVKNSWNKDAHSSDLAETLVLKIRRLRKDLRIWKKETVEDIFQCKKRLINEIRYLDKQEEETSLSTEESEERTNLKSKLTDIIS